MKAARPKSVTVVALTPSCWLAPEMAIAACRAGATGVLDLGNGRQPAEIAAALARLTREVPDTADWGVRWDAHGDESGKLATLSALCSDALPVPLLVLAGVDFEAAARLREDTRTLADTVFLEVYDLKAAQAAQAAGFEGVVVKGHESGGRVSLHASFMLLQEFSGQLDIPWWIQGGIGVRSAPAAALAGASGVVVGEPLWLAEEGPFTTAAQRAQWSRLDGSETIMLGADDEIYRFFSRSGRAQLRELEVAVAQGEPWQATLAGKMRDDDGLIPLGQDIAFAPYFAERYGTVGRMVTALREQMVSAVEQAAAQTPLAPNSALAKQHGTRYPIAQGPMTRVSDEGAFALAVAEGGALPFLALAVLRGKQVRAVLERTAALIGERAWGVGILGFLPLELRQAQMEVVRDFKPPFAIIAGGRPSQARELEEAGTITYLHVPSPGLLRGFLADGARRFVLEGSECGGHTGPRTSFILWESAIDLLVNADIKDSESVQVLFAGGVHDALSAAMVSVMAAPLVARGMKIGVLMGTAYLFTHEIVARGAVVEEFQRQAVACEKTTLLQSGVGVYTRCARTPFCDEFEKVRRELILASSSEEDTLMKLEMMNIGRLRIAAKGIAHRSDAEMAGGDDGYVEVDEATQRREGIYMLGEVARLRHGTYSVAELHENVSAGSEALLRRRRARPVSTPGRGREEDIAIVGMACLFPGSDGLRSYWQNILRGVDAIREVSDDRWRVADMFDPKRGTPDKIYSKWGGFLDDIAFDPQRYGIAPASLASIEPVQLLALEVSRLALEDAGFDRRSFARDKTATIFAVGGMNDLGTIFSFRSLLPHYLRMVPDLSDAAYDQILASIYSEVLPKWTEDTFPGILGNVIAGRVANRLDLGGANFTVDAACASSLAALDVGIRQLRSHDADVALVGGVDGTNGALGFMCFAQTYALSPRGRSRPFDDSADGIAISEGVGAAVLKRLADAERDGDRIYAVIKGIGSSSDGRNRSLTAPHPPAQVTALKRAYADAGVDPAAVTLIEAHGTGTALGDKSEISSLNTAFGEASSSRQVCAVGSVKSMIGHTKVAAGMAGLIKAALALRHRVLPPTIGVERPASGIDFATSPFYVNTEMRPWLHEGRAHPRYCGVSAFGFGGTNFHTVLAEYTGSYRESDTIDLNPRDAEIFAVAGPNREATEQAARRILQGLEHAEHIDLAQLAWSLCREQSAVKRVNGSHSCRLVVLATSVADLKHKLARVLELLPNHSEITMPPALFYREKVEGAGGVCFLFPGQGSQRVNMLRDLVASMPALQACFDEDPATIDSEAGPVARYIYPLPAFDEAAREHQKQALNDTTVAQPALGMAGMAAFDVLTRFGLRPDFTAGHSYGEYAALCAAGALSRADLIRLSKVRGRLSAAAPEGAMAALEADGPRVAGLVAEHGLGVVIANLNAPDQTIVSGTVEAIDAALPVLAATGMRVKKLPVSAAFHCAIMAGPRDALATELASVDFAAPAVPVYSNTTGAPYPSSGEAVRELLARHIAEPVRFTDEVEALYAAGARVFVECGPGLVLGALVDRILGERPHATLGLDAPGRPGWLQLAQLLAQAQVLGLLVRLDAWFAHRGLRDWTVDEVFADASKRAAPGPLVWRVNAARARPWHAPKGTLARRPAAAVAAATGAAGITGAAPGTARAATTPDIRPVAAAGPATVIASAPPAAAASLAPAVAAPAPAAAAVPAAMPVPQPTTSTISDRRTAMKMENLPGEGPAVIPTASPAGGVRCSEVEFAQIQYGVVRLLDLQFEQQRSLRHFIDFQAQLVGATLQRSPMAEPAVQPMPLALPVAVPVAAAQPVPPVSPVSQPVVQAASASVSLTLDAVPPTPVLPKQIAAAAAPAAAARRVTPAASIGPIEPALVSAETVPAASARPAAAPATPEEFKADLLQTVSERTGYPPDMLDLDAHMEADLGIDSIKRIEIFSGLTTKYNLLGERDEEAVIEELSGLKSLNEIIAWYARTTEEAADAVTVDAGGLSSKKATTPPSTPSEAVESDESAAHGDPVQCYALQAVAAGLDGAAVPGGSPAGASVLLVGSGPLADAFDHALREHGGDVKRVAPGTLTRAFGATHYEADFSSLESVRALRESIAASADGNPQPLGALVNLMGAQGGAHCHDARALFLLLKAFESDLKASGAWIVNVTAFDGQFGLSRSRAFEAESAGVLGVAKSAAREWASVKVKCIDFDPALDAATQASHVIAELRSGEPGVEVGYTAAGRWRLDLKRNGVVPQDLSRLTLDPDAVVLVTGGACGITADVTRALAERYRPRLILVGRSALPEEEPDAIVGVEDPAEVKQILIRDLRARQGKVTPAEVDRVYKRILRDREIQANLAAMRAAGSEVEYHSLDVRDEKAFGQLIDRIYARWGRIDGVLHGAGVISDKLIVDKPLDAFDAVFDTKVTPALVLERKLKPELLKFIVFFSSVTGRFGNVGQSDYSAANEVLNKLADRMCHTWPHVHAISINWGPWDAGMVSDELRRLYASRSIRPIPVEQGRRHFIEELERGARGEPELVISSSIQQIAMLRLGNEKGSVSK